jgi:hypothetical protein
MSMVRTIRTEMSFEPADIESEYAAHTITNSHVAIAWVPYHSDQPIPLFENAGGDDPLRDFPRSLEIGDVEEFLNGLLQGVQPTPLSRLTRFGDMPNRVVVEAVLEQPVVIERSPAETFSLATLLKTAGPSVAIGTIAGIQAAPFPLMLLVTIPTGILLVGTAITLTKALEKLIPELLGVADATPPLTPQWAKRRTSTGTAGHSRPPPRTRKA